MQLCAQYGNPDSFYGNIQLARWSPLPGSYGGWPEDVPANSPMLNWAEPEVVGAPRVDPAIAENIEIIRRLKAELSATEDTVQRAMIRARIDEARRKKVAAFQLAARIEEEESSFILLH